MSDDWDFARAWLKPLLDEACAGPGCDWQISAQMTVACRSCGMPSLNVSRSFRVFLEEYRRAEGYY
jgi:hypothetical protein